MSLKQRRMELDRGGYTCSACGRERIFWPYLLIRGTVYTDIKGARWAGYDYLCEPCWRIECLGAGIVW